MSSPNYTMKRNVGISYSQMDAIAWWSYYIVSSTLSFPIQKSCLNSLLPSTYSNLGMHTLVLWNNSCCHDLHVVHINGYVLVLISIHFSEAFNTNGHSSLQVTWTIFSFQDTTLSYLQHLWMLLSVSGHPPVSGQPLNVEFHGISILYP